MVIRHKDTMKITSAAKKEMYTLSSLVKAEASKFSVRSFLVFQAYHMARASPR